MKLKLLSLFYFLLCAHLVHSQTNPTPLTLPVSENFGTASFTTPKPGMASWAGSGTRPYGTQAAAEASDAGADVTLSGATPASGSAGGQYGHAPAGDGRLTVLLSSNTTNGTTQVVMAINTTGASSVVVAYDLVMTVSNARDFGLALQYRVGTTGTFTTVAGSSVIYNATSVNGGDADGATDFDNYSFTLPANAADEPVVQLRWISWRPTGSGNAPGVGIDNISVTSGAVNPCAEPTAQATALNLTPALTSIAGSFTAAASAADQYLVVRSLSSTLSAQPVDGTIYSAGQSLGGGTVVSVSASASFNATGLTASTNYYFFVYALNSISCSGGPNYFITNALTANTTTLTPAACAAPTDAATNLILTSTNTSISGSFTASASANRYLVVRSLNSTLSSAPVNGTTYSAGQSFAGGTVVAYNNATSFVATGLTINTTYYLFVFAANGDCTGEPFYNTTALTDSKATTNNTTNLPPAYYNAANGLTCAPLKTALSTIVTTGAVELTYTPGLWDAYYRTDVKRNDANTANVVWDMYSDNPAGPDPYTYTLGSGQCGTYNSEGDCYNREHSFPRNWFGGAVAPMNTDIMHIFPTDGWVNNLRNNFPYGETSSPTTTSLNGSKLGPSSFTGYTGVVFEPINEYKGDFARAQFYMVTRYENQVAAWQANGNANEVLNGTAYQSFDDWYLKLLYKWHVQDPVSQKEINRNDSIFIIQGNRNPFVDHPEWVVTVWSCTGVIATTGINDILSLSQKAVVIYPNPVVNKIATLKLEKPFTQTVSLQVIDITGRVLKQHLLPAGQTVIQLQVHELNAGIYSVKINTTQGIITKTFVVQ